MNPRIHIEFASDASMAAILRRGPTRWVQLLQWDTSNDVVHAGSWFHGRIYEHSCTLSPNGELFAYLATKYGGKKTRGVDYAWTAVSKLPWLTALALWPQSDTWGGSALFTSNETLVIACSRWDQLSTKDRLPKGFTVLPRWIGVGAPTQTFPEPPTTSAYFREEAGVDQAGRAFKYVDGKLIREDTVIIDLASMQPQPKASPDYAHTW